MKRTQEDEEATNKLGKKSLRGPVRMRDQLKEQDPPGKGVGAVEPDRDSREGGG